MKTNAKVPPARWLLGSFQEAVRFYVDAMKLMNRFCGVRGCWGGFFKKSPWPPEAKK